MTVGSLFSGIGGLDLGLERAGMVVRWQVESDPYCQRMLEKHWPDVERYGDIRSIDPCQLERVDVVCGGFPCQPVSSAGKKLAQADDRWLWPEFARVVRGVRPSYVIVENVPGLLVRGFGDVLGDLAGLGFDAEWESLTAEAFGAPHIRRRVFLVAWQRQLVADADGEGQPDVCGRSDQAGHAGRSTASASGVADADEFGWQSRRASVAGHESGAAFAAYAGQWSVEPDVGRVAHGVPARVDRLRGLGNAVVPQVAEWVGRRVNR